MLGEPLQSRRPPARGEIVDEAARTVGEPLPQRGSRRLALLPRQQRRPRPLRYLNFSFESLFNPHVYQDAGLPRPLEIRNRLLSSPSREEKERQVFRKTLPYLVKVGIFTDTDLTAVRDGSAS